MTERPPARGARQLGRAIRERLSYSNVMATAAVFIALGGSAWAVAANSVGSKQLKRNAVAKTHVKKNAISAAELRRNAVRPPKIRGGAVRTQKLADGAVATSKVQDNAITGAKVDESTLGPVPFAQLAARAEGLAVLPLTRAPLLDHPGTAADARAAAPEVTLFSKGQLTIYGKCFRPGSGNLHVGTYLKTSADGAVFDAHDDLQGGANASNFLNTSTPETQAEIHDEDSIGPDTARADNPLTDSGGNSNDSFAAAAPDGTTLGGRVLQGVKQGNAPLNGGALGSADGCQWWGYVLG